MQWGRLQRVFVGTVGFCVFLAGSTLSESVYFPHTISSGQDVSGIVDVTQAPYNADNTGQSDATAAIQQALDGHQSNTTIYLPNGTYLVSNTLTWLLCPGYCDGSAGSRGPFMQGQSRANTVIKLASGSFTNTSSPKAVIHTGEGVAQNFDRGLYNLTVYVSSNNAGAWGVYWYSNNEGLMSDVDIISEDGGGLVGLHLGIMSEQGPTTVRNVHVEGFARGISAEYPLNDVVLFQISLANQSECGVITTGHPLFIDSLTSVNTVPAVVLRSGGKIVLNNARLTGGSSSNAAISVESGRLYARHIEAEGYSRAISGGSAPSGLSVYEYSSIGSTTLHNSPTAPMDLPVKYPPDPAWEEDSTKWTNIVLYKGGFGVPQRSDAEALQAAIDDASKTTVVIPSERVFQLDDTVFVRGNISRIIGTPGNLSGGTVVIEDGTAPVVKLQRIFGNSNIVNRTSRTVIIEAKLGADVYGRGTGELYITDLVGHAIIENPAQRTWIWGYDAEAGPVDEAEDGVVVNGGIVRMFGWKSEGSGVKVRQRGGAFELIGFLQYDNSWNTNMGSVIMMDVNEGQICVAGMSQTNFTVEYYTHLVQQTLNGTTENLMSSGNSAGGTDIGLFCGYYDTTLSQLTANRPERSVPQRAESLRVLGMTTVGDGHVAVTYTLPRAGQVGVELLDALGRRVAGQDLGYQKAGAHETNLATAGLPDGTYCVRLKADSAVESRRTVIVR